MGRSRAMGLIARATFLAVAIGAVGVNAWFAFTDAAWVLMGSPSETYPELFYLLSGLPLSLGGLAGASSAIWAFRTGRDNLGIARAALWIGVATTALSLLLAAAAFLPPDTGASSGLGDAVGNVLLLGSPLLMFVQFGLALGSVFGSPPRKPRAR